MTDKILSNEDLDAFEKLAEIELDLKKKKAVIKSITASTIERKHQTLVAVLVSEEVSSNSRERIERFVTSLNNHMAIKTDTVTVVNGNIYPGLQYISGTPGGVDMNKFGKEAGYTQVCILTPTEGIV